MSAGRPSRVRSQGRSLALWALAGALFAALTVVAWGGDGPGASISGTVLDVTPGARVVVVATRNDCADPDRNPVELTRTTRVGSGPFTLAAASVGPGVGWVCAYESRGGGPVDRYVQAWMPRRLQRGSDGDLAAPTLELHLADGLPLPDPEGPPPERRHDGEGPR